MVAAYRLVLIKNKLKNRRKKTNKLLYAATVSYCMKLLSIRISINYRLWEVRKFWNCPPCGRPNCGHHIDIGQFFADKETLLTVGSSN